MALERLSEMALEKEGQPERAAETYAEDACHYDFNDFFEKAEFCDRDIYLEVLEESNGASTKKEKIRPSSVPQGGSPEKRTKTEQGPASSSALPQRQALLPDEPQEIQPGKKRKADSTSWPQEEQDETMPVNSIVLAAKSPVLRAMLTNGMRESNKNADIILKVTPSEKPAFKEMVRFMYTGKVSESYLSPDTSARSLVDLLTAGDKFEVRSFIAPVVQVIKKREQLDRDPSVYALHISEELQQHEPIRELVAESRDRFVETYRDAREWCSSDAFLALDVEEVSLLLQSEELEADSEEELFTGVLKWVSKQTDAMAERQEAMEKLSEYLRFGRMRGEFLVRHVLPLPEMASPECQERVKQGIFYLAFTDVERAKMTETVYQERQGILEAPSLELECSLTMKKNGAPVKSRASIWQGVGWCVLLERNADRGTVELYLHCEASDTEKTVGFDFFVKVWPDGKWQQINELSTHTFSDSFPSSGYIDALDAMLWDDATKSKKYVDSSKQITFKVVVSKL